MLFDVGHANVVAGDMGVELMTLLEPVLDCVGLFHVHDNLGARLRRRGRPYRSTRCNWTCTCPRAAGTCPGSPAPALLAHDAPLVMEIHPAHRPAPTALREIAVSVLGGREAARAAAVAPAV